MATNNFGVGNEDAYDIAGQSSYSQYKVDNVSGFDPGVLVLPVASETSNSVQVRCHGGLSTRRVTFDIRKQGNPPVIPLPSDNVGVDVLTSAEVNVLTPSPDLQSGGYDWTVKGEYLYVTEGEARVFGVDQLPLTSYPYINERQDTIAAESLLGRTPITLSSEIKQAHLVVTGGWVWPIMTYPTNLLMNPNLLGE